MASSPASPFFTDVHGSTYRLVEPGRFLMGDVNGNPTEQPTCTVEISQPFFLGERNVTQAFWLDIMGENPSKFQEGWSAGLRPVENINMNDVQLFIERLNQRDVEVMYLGLLGHWRLPSESEWEYASRADTQGRWSFGDKDIELDEYGWHAGNSGGTTREVGLKKANPWGFFDMNGLVQEWCADHWVKNYEGGRQQRPLLNDLARKHVVRGGAWFTESDSTRCGARSFADREKRSDGLGLRLVWAPLDSQPVIQIQGASPSSKEQS